MGERHRTENRSPQRERNRWEVSAITQAHTGGLALYRKWIGLRVIRFGAWIWAGGKSALPGGASSLWLRRMPTLSELNSQYRVAVKGIYDAE